MKKIIMAGFLLFTTWIAMSQEKVVVNDKYAQVRNVSGFSEISVSGGIDLYLSPDDHEVVVVSANEEKYRDRIVTRVEGNRLEIYFDWKKSGTWPNMNLKAYVSFRTLTKLKASGSSDVFVNGVIKSDRFRLDLSGSSDFKGAFNVRELELAQSGSSDSRLSGRAERISIDLSGASDVKGYDFEVDYCDAEASGASDIQITIQKELTARASGSSDIYYRGNGVIREVKASGSSSVSKRE